MLNRIIRFFLDNKLVAYLLLLLFIGWGLVTAPFDYGINWLPRDAVSVDAIPNTGENQQIIFTEWSGRSPQDVEDQITYPLSTSLLGVPGVKSIRSNSMFGFSMIYLIFEDDIEFYWSRTRVLEKINSLPPKLLPPDVQPKLGPEATAMGQVFWYTLEGQDSVGNSTGGWDLHELRSIQDFYVKYALAPADGVAEVASIGGHIKEYQVDIDPNQLKRYQVSIQQVMTAIRESNLDIGARTIEINQVEYFVRGLGYVKTIADIENAVVKNVDNVPIRIKDLAKVNIGPSDRRGILDKSGAEVVGGVVVARYGANPMKVIENVKNKIQEIESGLPSKTLKDGTTSTVKIVPFYDRSELIHETLGTLEEALGLEILITIIVVILMLFNLRSSILVSGALPVAVLMCFIAMRYFGVEANVVALSGIAIAIGTMVDMGIVLAESIVGGLKEAPSGQPIKTTIYNATTEVASAIVTAVATTVISFIPVFTMQGAEGKLFGPLAFTKTFALAASIVIAITIIPSIAEQVFSVRRSKSYRRWIGRGILVLLSVLLLTTNFSVLGYMGLIVAVMSQLSDFFKKYKNGRYTSRFVLIQNIAYAAFVAFILSRVWMPLGVNHSLLTNFLFVSVIIALLIGTFYVIIHHYERILMSLLQIKWLFILFVCLLITVGAKIMFSTKQEFMPPLDEGSFLLMPSSMPHAGVQANLNSLRALDMAVTSIPEIETVVGKAGRSESSLDPAPLSMFENIITYKSEYKTDDNGRRLRFKVDDNNNFVHDKKGNLIPDVNGKYFRQWRDHIHSPDDIWNEIVKASKVPGLTSAPKLQPIETRRVMLQTGMRSPMGIKVRGPSLDTIEAFGLQLEQYLKEVDGVKSATVFAERMVGKPYLLIDLIDNQIDRYGLTRVVVQQQIQAAIGGMVMTSTVEGRERYGIRIRYPRELRSDPEAIKRIIISTPSGSQIELGELVQIKYEKGPQSIKSEDVFLVGYVTFDKEEGYSEVEVVENAIAHLQNKEATGELRKPKGVTYRFAGTYEQHVASNKRLSIVIPIALIIIFLILYFQFKSATISLMVFSGVFVAFAGGFIMIWLYNQEWFLDFNLLGVNIRELFQVKTINMSVAVWVGFLALFGIATDDGVLVATFLRDSFKRNNPSTVSEIRQAVVEGGKKRVKPAMMTTATTILALLPVLTSTGRGSDIMVPMAIPSFGGMLLQVMTMFTVPVLYSWWKETRLKTKKK